MSYQLIEEYLSQSIDPYIRRAYQRWLRERDSNVFSLNIAMDWLRQRVESDSQPLANLDGTLVDETIEGEILDEETESRPQTTAAVWSGLLCT